MKISHLRIQFFPYTLQLISLKKKEEEHQVYKIVHSSELRQ